MTRREYRVDFKLIRNNPRQNRKVFTFAMAADPYEAATIVITAQARNLEKIEITKVTEVRR